MKKKLQLSCTAVCAGILMSGCVGEGTNQNTLLPQQQSMENAKHAESLVLAAEPPAMDRIIPDSFKCQAEPKALTEEEKIAWSHNCAVGNDQQGRDFELRKMALALMHYNPETKKYDSYCTATPVKFGQTSNTGRYVGFAITAAHCVVGNTKAPGVKLTTNNIITWSNHEEDKIYQGTQAKGINAGDLPGKITAVYVPDSYCQIPAIVKKKNGGASCNISARQGGDIAVIRFETDKRHGILVSNNVELMPSNYALNTGEQLLALGYGQNTTSTPNDSKLYYTNYTFFDKNVYQGVSSDWSLMNGYQHPNKLYSSLICPGDSGGGDFYSSVGPVSRWYLVGVHSWGSSGCGSGPTPDYHKAYDVSTDVRPFSKWVTQIMDKDPKLGGCYKQQGLDKGYICRSN